MPRVYSRPRRSLATLEENKHYRGEGALALVYSSNASAAVVAVGGDGERAASPFSETGLLASMLSAGRRGRAMRVLVCAGFGSAIGLISAEGVRRAGAPPGSAASRSGARPCSAALPGSGDCGIACGGRMALSAGAGAAGVRA